VVGVSADPPETNLAWARELKLPFRLLSDVRPAGDVGRRWGVWDELWKIQRRSTFIVDREGVVRWTEGGAVCIDTSRALEALGRLAAAR
jgi:peroxiredoxin